MLDRFAAAIDKLLVVVASATILLMLCITTISVIGRYLFKTPIPDDVVMNELLIVVLVFLPFAYVQRMKQHVFVTLFSDRMSPRNQLICETFGNVVGLVFFALLSHATFLDYREAYAVLAYNEGLLKLPEYPSRFAVFFGIAMMTVRLAIDVINGVHGIIKGNDINSGSEAI